MSEVQVRVGLGSQPVHFPVGRIRPAHKSPFQLVLLAFPEIVHNAKAQFIDSFHCLLVNVKDEQTLNGTSN